MVAAALEMQNDFHIVIFFSEEETRWLFEARPNKTSHNGKWVIKGLLCFVIN